MTKKLFIFFLLVAVTGFGQRKLKEFISKKIIVQKDTIQIDSVSINPVFFKLLNSKNEVVSKEKYQVDFSKAIVILDKDEFSEIIIEYVKYPAFLTKTYTPFNEKLIVPNTSSTEKLYSLTTNKKKKDFNLFDGLKTQGFIARGITTGNNQNVVTNASLDLTIEGKLSKDVSIRANIFDTNFPLQQNGYSQSITDFDRIFIELFNEKWKAKGGDVSLTNKGSYFLNFDKQISGLQVEVNINDNFNAGASGAIVRGQFSSYNFVGVEGNQGPYKIFGFNNKSNIVIVAGSDVVFVNGIPLERGENKDYSIDYNLAEIRFNTTYPITNDMRVRIEFQFSDRNYTRFITYEKAQYKNDKFAVTGFFYNENDAKNQPVQQDLTSNQKQILATAGNDISQMVAPSVFTDEFSESKIQYKKIIVNGTEVFEFSTDETAELFSVTFSDVGTNLGSYVIDRTIAIGTIYRYAGADSGDFEPIIRLVAPTSLQVAVINSQYTPSKKTTIKAELAYSNRDQNLFSSTDDGKNKQLASKLQWNQIIFDKKWKLSGDMDYEFVQENFRTVQRFRSVEFNRDWNLRNRLGDQHQVAASFMLKNKQDNFVLYRFNHLSFSEGFKGNKYDIQSNISTKKSLFRIKSSFLSNISTIEKDAFFRLNSNYEYRFKKSWIGGLIHLETNKIKNITANTFNNLSHQFQEYEGYYGIGDSTKIFAKAGLNFRTNDSIRNNAFTRINNRNTLYFNSRLIQNETTNLSVYTNYRFTDNNLIENEQSLNSKVVYNQKFFKNFLNVHTAYETSSGNIAQQDFVYAKTEAGQGFYLWNDYNNDGEQQFEEFEVAEFQDQATYLRVPLPNLRFLPTQKASLKQSVILSSNQWKTRKGFQKFLSRFYNQTYLSINNKRRRIGASFNLNPFNLNENELVGLHFNFRNSFFFNRNLQKYSWIYTCGKSRNKQQFSIGGQENNAFIHQLEFKHKLSSFWLFELTSSYAENRLDTENFTTRNYELKHNKIHPKLTFLYDKDHRFSLLYQFKDKKNVIGNTETLKQQRIGAEYFYLTKKKNQISANFSIFLNDFEGNTNSPVGYQMLEGLQVGQNFTWNILFNQNLNSFLNLNLNYFGRKSESSRVIHSGTIQLKAIF